MVVTSCIRKRGQESKEETVGQLDISSDSQASRPNQSHLSIDYSLIRAIYLIGNDPDGINLTNPWLKTVSKAAGSEFVSNLPTGARSFESPELPKTQSKPPIVGYLKHANQSKYAPVYKVSLEDSSKAVSNIQQIIDSNPKNTLGFKVDASSTPSGGAKTPAKIVEDFLASKGFSRFAGNVYFQPMPRVELPENSLLGVVQATRAYDVSTKPRTAVLYDFDDTLTRVEQSYEYMLDTFEGSPVGRKLLEDTFDEVFEGALFATRRKDIEEKFIGDPEAGSKIQKDLSELAQAEVFNKISRNIDAPLGKKDLELEKLTDDMFKGTHKNGIVDSISGFLRKDEYVGVVTNNGSPTLVKAFLKYHISKLDPEISPKVDQIAIVHQDFAKTEFPPERGKNTHIAAIVPFLNQTGPIKKIVLVDDLPGNIRAFKSYGPGLKGLTGNQNLDVLAIQPGRQTRHDELTGDYIAKQEDLDSQAVAQLRAVLRE